jgi:hypothetical protein
MAVVSMADAMKQFDFNGNQVGSYMASAGTPTKSLSLPTRQDQPDSSVLTIGGK